MREIVRPGIVLFLITLVAAVALGAVHKVTEGPIAAQRAAQSGAAAFQKYIPSATSFEEIDPAVFDKIDKFFVAYENNSEAGYIVINTVKGYGGDIELLVVLDEAGCVSDFVLMNHGETPGLGTNAEKPEFIDQYRGKGGPFTVVTGTAANENEIVAVTSATITSSAVTQGVNRGLSAFSLYQDIAAGVAIPTQDPNASPWQKYIPSATEFEELDSSQFSEINSFVVAYENDQEIGYAAEATVKGFGGDIVLVVVLNNDAQVVNIVVTEHEETPGLGSKIEDADFVDKYVGKTGPFVVVTGAASGENDIEAIAGATISADAVTLGVNKVLSALAARRGVELVIPEKEEEEPVSADSFMQQYFPSATKSEEVNSAIDGISSFTVAYENEQVIGYLIETIAKGFGGDMELLIALNANGQVEDIGFLSHNETPGLGTKAEDPAYIGQFQGKSGPFTVVATAAAGENDVEAIAGATVSCTAVAAGANNALFALSAHMGQEPEGIAEGTESEEAVEESQAMASSPMQKYIPSATTFEEIKPGIDGIKSFTIASANDQEVGYIANASVSGFAGPIELIVVLGQSGQVQDVVVVSHTETPGLGSKAEEPAFLDQYKGKSGSISNSDIDAIAAATITSDAVTLGVNKALSVYQDVIIKGVR